MHDINKELEKFFQLLEEAESSTENEAGSPTSKVSQTIEPDRNPVQSPTTQHQQRLESDHPQASQDKRNAPPVGPTKPPPPVTSTPQTPRTYVEPTPLDSLPPRTAARPTTVRTNGTYSDQQQPPVQRQQPPVQGPQSPIESQTTPLQGSAVPPNRSQVPSANGQSNLDQLMQEVRGKLNQPARPNSASVSAAMSPQTRETAVSSISVEAPAALAAEKVTPTWRKGVLTGLAMVLPACLALAIILNKPDPTIDIDTSGSLVENANALPAEQAELSMTSTPSGARIFLDGELFGVTPFESIRIKPGEYQVTAEVPGYASIDTVLTLRARHWVSLNIPNGDDQTFLANGDTAPDHILAGLESDANDVSTEDDAPATRQEPESQTVEETRPQRRPERTTPRPRPTTGSIMFTSEPAGATVFLDGERKGVTPLSLGDVQGGSHSVRYALDGYDEYSIALELTPGIQTPLHGALSAAFGTVILDIASTGSVFVDGSLAESDVSGRRTLELTAGSHTIAIQRSGMVPWEMTVDVEPGQAQTIEVSGGDSGFPDAFAEAEALYGRGDYQAARDAFEKARLLDPSNRLVTGKIAEIDRLLEAELMQERTEAIIENGVYLITDTPPKLVGGLEGLHNRVKYPEAAYQAGVTGRVYIQFVVNEDGTASNFTVTKGLPFGCNEEAIRAIETAKFEPATFDGRSVRARHTLFVNFGQ